MQTEIELENGQSFAIAGLLDNRFNETSTRFRGSETFRCSGKLFQSRVLIEEQLGTADHGHAGVGASRPGGPGASRSADAEAFYERHA